MADKYFSNVQMKDGTIVNVKDELARTQLANKVDKVDGMGLSSNDFTTAEKNKLAGISPNAVSVSYNSTLERITFE